MAPIGASTCETYCWTNKAALLEQSATLGSRNLIKPLRATQQRTNHELESTAQGTGTKHADSTMQVSGLTLKAKITALGVTAHALLDGSPLSGRSQSETGEAKGSSPRAGINHYGGPEIAWMPKRGWCGLRVVIGWGGRYSENLRDLILVGADKAVRHKVSIKTRNKLERSLGSNKSIFLLILSTLFKANELRTYLNLIF